MLINRKLKQFDHSSKCAKLFDRLSVLHFESLQFEAEFKINKIVLLNSFLFAF